MLRTLDLPSAEQFVESNRPSTRPTPAAHWDGWTLVLTFPSKFAEKDPNGIRVPEGNYWAIAKRIDPDRNGNYRFVFKKGGR